MAKGGIGFLLLLFAMSLSFPAVFDPSERHFIAEESKKLNIPVPDRKEVYRYLSQMLKDKKSLETAFRRASLYLPYIKPILKKHGLPEELALLPMIESGFNPFAVSKSGAGGLWQLMPTTARKYGLRVDKNIDERFDLLKSTEAAAKYLKDLYKKFGSWELVLAAYNCGEGCVKRRTSGRDFWRTKWALPKQTRKYVPLFFATLLIAKNPEKYGLRIEPVGVKIEKRLIARPHKVTDIVRTFNLKETTFRDLNPHLKGEKVPPGAFVYVPKKRFKRKPLKVVKRDTAKVIIKAPGQSTRKVTVIRLKNGARIYIKE